MLVQLFLAVISEEFVDAENKRKDQNSFLRKAATKLQAQARGHLVRQQKVTAVVRDATALRDAAALEPWRRALRRQMGRLQVVSQAVVLYNVAVIALQYYGESDEWVALRTRAGDVATWFFIGEMGAKLLCFGWREYWSEAWNVLDGSLVLCSLVEIALHVVFAELTLDVTPMLRMLRILRILRSLRTVRSMPTLYKMTASFTASLPQVANLVVLVFFMCFIFAIIGMQLFGGSGLSDLTRQHFDTFPAAMLTVLSIRTCPGTARALILTSPLLTMRHSYRAACLSSGSARHVRGGI